MAERDTADDARSVEHDRGAPLRAHRLPVGAGWFDGEGQETARGVLSRVNAVAGRARRAGHPPARICPEYFGGATLEWELPTSNVTVTVTRALSFSAQRLDTATRHVDECVLFTYGEVDAWLENVLGGAPAGRVT